MTIRKRLPKKVANKERGEVMLTYDKYLELGGNLPEDDFPLFLTHANIKLDFITANKWSEFDYEESDIALKCELLLTKVMNLLQEQDTHKRVGIKSYSNGIESIQYDDTYTDKAINKQIKNLCVEYLNGTGLLYRGVK